MDYNISQYFYCLKIEIEMGQQVYVEIKSDINVIQICWSYLWDPIC